MFTNGIGIIKSSLGLRSNLPFSIKSNEVSIKLKFGNRSLEKFKSINFDYTKNVVFSCGSGVTASVLALAYSLINDKYIPTIYDGSWSEYGKS